MAKEHNPGVHTTEKPRKNHHTVALPTNNDAVKYLCVGGHLITNKTPDENKIVAILFEAWKTKSNVSAKYLGKNLFLFCFESKEDGRSILSLGPWFVDGQMIVLKVWDIQTPFDKIDFTTNHFWVQAHNLPPNKMSRESAIIIGNQVGEFRDFDDPKRESFGCRTFLRLKIKFNITESLPCGIYMDCQPDTDIWIAFKYEKLQDFCYGCGKLGHEKQDCRSPLSLNKTRDRFGPWMKANDSSQSHTWLTIHNNVAPSTTMDSTRPKQITTNIGKTHTSHPEHELKLKNYRKPYTCDGCKGHGFGKRYRCEQCDYDLHEDCMFTTPTTSHKFFRNSTFKFYEQPPRKCNKQYCDDCKRYCDACGKHVKGFVYHCPKTLKDLHPCCCNLKNELEIDGLKFCLRETVSKCSWCNQTKIKDSLSKIKGWSYVSECDKYNFHVYCAIEMVVEGWKDGTANDNDCLALENLDLRSIRSHLNRNRGRGNKYLRIVKIFLRTIISILIGDPTNTLASVLVDLLV